MGPEIKITNIFIKLGHLIFSIFDVAMKIDIFANLFNFHA
jgi:hypothetical protein